MQFEQSEKLAETYPQLRDLIHEVDLRLFTLSLDAIVDPALWARSLREQEARVVGVMEQLTDEGLLEKVWGIQCDCGIFSSTESRSECQGCGLTGSGCALFMFSPQYIAASKRSKAAMSLRPEILAFQQNEDEIQALSILFRAGRVTPFVGAGMTIPCGYPGWSSFLLSEASLHGIQDPVQSDIAAGRFEEAAERLLNAQGAFLFDRRIQHVYGNPKTIGGPIRHLPRLVTNSVITTNFDRTIERLFHERQRYLVPVIGSRAAVMSQVLFGTAPYLLKVHGDAIDYADRVLTKSEYSQQYGEGPPWQASLPSGLVRLFSATSLLFVGCSLSSDRTMTVLREAIKVPAAPTHFAIVEAPSDMAMLAERRRQLGELRIAPIWYPHGEHSWVDPLLDMIATGAAK